jgi:RNA polymerase sigma factor (sigma-70 family)
MAFPMSARSSSRSARLLDVRILGPAAGPAIGRTPDAPASNASNWGRDPPRRLMPIARHARSGATAAGRQVFDRSMDDKTHDADRALAARLADDLDAAFEAVVTTHADRLFSIALRILGDRSDAEEAAQDAFVRAYRALATYDASRIRELRLRPWLATILVNVCRNRTRVHRVATVELAFDPGAEPAADPLARRDARDAWASLLSALPPAQRTAVVLRHVDGLSYAEMADALGRPEGTLKAQVHRGLAALRDALLASRRSEREEMTA